MADTPILKPAERYVAMDGLRGLAALSVVIFHFETFGPFPSYGGNAAVDLFFIMSGFVIANAYETRLKTLGLWGFFKIRMARLYPTYALSLLIVPLFTAFIWLISYMPPDAWRVYASIPFQALYLPSPPSVVPANRAAFFINGPAWSLFWEVAINIVYAVTLPRLRTGILVSVIAVGALGLIAVVMLGMDVLSGSDWPTWWVGGIRVLFGFPLGVLLHRLPRARFKVPFIALALLALSSIFAPPLVSLFLILPLTVWLSTGNTADNRFSHELGELSYPLYALHVPLHDPFSWAAKRVLHLEAFDQKLFILVGVCATAWLALVLWDRPIRQYLSQRRKRPRASAAML